MKFKVDVERDGYVAGIEIEAESFNVKDGYLYFFRSDQNGENTVIVALFNDRQWLAVYQEDDDEPTG